MEGKRFWNPAESQVERAPDQLVVSCEQPGIMVTPHWHAQPEVNFVFRGAVDYDMHGQRLRLTAGTVALFWGGLPHRVIDTGPDTFFHAIHLPLRDFFRVRLAPALVQRVMRGAVLLTEVPAADDGPAFLRRAEAMRSGDAARLSHAVDELLLRLARIPLEAHRMSEPEAGAGSVPLVAEAAATGGVQELSRFMALNFRDEIDSHQIAAAAGLHPKYAMNLFRRATGLTMGDYLSLLRVSYAQALLIDSDQSILQVAMESGFGSVSAFNKCFRKTAGMTPSAFRAGRIAAI